MFKYEHINFSVSALRISKYKLKFESDKKNKNINKLVLGHL